MATVNSPRAGANNILETLGQALPFSCDVLKACTQMIAAIPMEQQPPKGRRDRATITQRQVWGLGAAVVLATVLRKTQWAGHADVDVVVLAVAVVVYAGLTAFLLAAVVRRLPSGKDPVFLAYGTGIALSATIGSFIVATGAYLLAEIPLRIFFGDEPSLQVELNVGVAAVACLIFGLLRRSRSLVRLADKAMVAVALTAAASLYVFLLATPLPL